MEQVLAQQMSCHLGSRFCHCLQIAEIAGAWIVLNAHTCRASSHKQRLGYPEQKTFFYYIFLFIINIWPILRTIQGFAVTVLRVANFLADFIIVFVSACAPLLQRDLLFTWNLIHPSIIQFYGSTIEDNNEMTRYWMLTEYHPLGSLQRYLQEDAFKHSSPDLLHKALASTHVRYGEKPYSLWKIRWRHAIRNPS